MKASQERKTKKQKATAKQRLITEFLVKDSKVKDEANGVSDEGVDASGDEANIPSEPDDEDDEDFGVPAPRRKRKRSKATEKDTPVKSPRKRRRRKQKIKFSVRKVRRVKSNQNSPVKAVDAQDEIEALNNALLIEENQIEENEIVPVVQKEHRSRRKKKGTRGRKRSPTRPPALSVVGLEEGPKVEEISLPPPVKIPRKRGRKSRAELEAMRALNPPPPPAPTPVVTSRRTTSTSNKKPILEASTSPDDKAKEEAKAPLFEELAVLETTDWDLETFKKVQQMAEKKLANTILTPLKEQDTAFKLEKVWFFKRWFKCLSNPQLSIFNSRVLSRWIQVKRKCP